MLLVVGVVYALISEKVNPAFTHTFPFATGLPSFHPTAAVRLLSWSPSGVHLLFTTPDLVNNWPTLPLGFYVRLVTKLFFFPCLAAISSSKIIHHSPCLPFYFDSFLLRIL